MYLDNGSVSYVFQDDMGSRFKGDTGDQGFPGQHGPQGERGVVEPGTKGEPGPDGSSGILGEDGAVEPKGEIGLQGLRGTEGAWERNSWRKNYRDTLQTQVLESARDRVKKVEFGAELSEGDLKLFQDEQVGQLYELMLESTKPNRQFDIQEEGFKK
ncbi:collectin-12-like isoform X4 [Salvelinus fontinalis]|uniref:collectin-12-like isoform X4 n=2 Tax=Salvelinus fontinalis TaxID=8038 RepID=UPI0024854ACB|nr:collectin-12-like isoform X4 [Salvelinus fontinalis]